MGTFVRTLEGTLVNVDLVAKIFTLKLGDGPAHLITLFDQTDRPLGRFHGTLEQLYRLIDRRCNDGELPHCSFWLH